MTARGLASELGWSVGTIYTVAPSIDAVTLEANAEELSEIWEEFERARVEMAQEGASPQQMIRGVGAIYLRFAPARPRSWAAIFERDAEGEPPDWYRDRQTRLFAVLEHALAPLVQTKTEARRAARTLWAALHGLLALSLAGHLARVSGAAETAAAPPAQDLETHALELIDVYLTGLAARSPAKPEER